MIRAFRAIAWPSDWVVLAYCGVLMAIAAAAGSRLPRWPLFVLGHAAVAVVSAGLAVASSRRPESRPLAFLRAWDTVAVVPALFFMVCAMVHRVNPHDLDPQLIAIDRAIGGIALLKAMESISDGWLTDLSKMFWVSYYFLPFFIGIPVWRGGDRIGFRNVKAQLTLGWTLSYLGYLAVPAQGPGYHAEAIGVAQPAWEESGLAPVTKRVIDALEGEARDTFPSGHAVIAGLVAWLLLRHRAGMWTPAGVILSLGVTFSTIYLRYHYLIDVVAGLVLSAFIVAGWEIARRRAARVPAAAAGAYHGEERRSVTRSLP